MALGKFRPATQNANKHTPKGLKALRESIQSVGYTEPMVAAADGEILSGSARLETVADVFGVDVEPLVIHSDGTRPVIHIRDDVPNAHTLQAQKIALAANRVAQLDWAPDIEVLAGYDAAVLEGLYEPAELSDLGQQWADVLGKDDAVDKSERAGSSPWDRVVASDKVRCLIGDLEFGINNEIARAWMLSIKESDLPIREAAEDWLTQHMQSWMPR